MDARSLLLQYPGLSEADRYQRRVLENLFAQEVTPPNPSDIPPVTDFPDMTIFIDEESKDAGAWAVTYRGLTSTTASDVETLEMSLPTWVLEFLLTGRSFHKEPVKLSFVLEPEGKNDLAELPGGCVSSFPFYLRFRFRSTADPNNCLPSCPRSNNRLSANRSLRARKISAYVSPAGVLDADSLSHTLVSDSHSSTGHGSTGNGHASISSRLSLVCGSHSQDIAQARDSAFAVVLVAARPSVRGRAQARGRD